MRKNLNKIYIFLLLVVFIFIVVKLINIYNTDNENKDKNIYIEGTDEGFSEKITETTTEDALSSNDKVIENYNTMFEWYGEYIPKTDTYSSSTQKSREYLAYGISTDEYEYMKTCYDEDVLNNDNNKLMDKYLGHGKYNKNKLLDSQETFNRKYMSVSSSIFGGYFEDKIKVDIDDRYLMEDTRDLILENLSDDRSCINNMMVYDADTGELCDNQKIYYVLVQIEIEAQSNWVQDVLLAPKLTYLKDDGDVLSEYNSPVYISINGERLSGHEYGIYIKSLVDDGLSFYDYSDENCRDSVPQCHWPLRIGETVGFYDIYLIPEAYLEDAYLVYNDLEEFGSVDYTYNLLDVSIFDLQREFDLQK